jgi:hypothetical protein
MSLLPSLVTFVNQNIIVAAACFEKDHIKLLDPIEEIDISWRFKTRYRR